MGVLDPLIALRRRLLASDAYEILDREGSASVRGRRILADLDCWNRLTRWYRFHCRMVAQHWEALGRPSPVRLVDIGTGQGSLLEALADHFDAASVPAELVGVDLSPSYVAMARTRLGSRARVVVADATDLPFDEGSFDIATSTLMMHHLPRQTRTNMVAELARVTRTTYLFDLELTFYGALGWAAASTLLGMSSDTRHDGVVSVRRGFTRDEFEQLVEPLSVDVRRALPSALCTKPRLAG